MKVFAKNNNAANGTHASQSKSADPFFGVQAKLAIGSPDDKYEKEADAMADKVVQKSEAPNSFFGNGNFFPPTTNTVTKTSEEDLQKKEDVEEIQEKPLVETITPVVQLASEDEEIQEKCDDCESEENTVQKMPFEEVQQQSEDEQIQEKCDDCESEENTVQKVAIEFPEVPEVGVEEAGPVTETSLPIEDAAPPTEETQGPAAGANTVDIPAIKPAKDKKEDAPQEVQTKPMETSNNKNNNVESNLKASKGNGSSLPTHVNSEMSSGFGTDFGHVKVHTDSSAVQMNKDLGAHAFTSGNDIYFNEGKFSPNTPSGKHLLAHELTHTVQQGATSGTVQKFEATAKTVTPEPAGEVPNDGVQVEGKANTKIDNDPNIDEGDDLSAEERAEKENPDRGEVRQEKASVHAEGVATPEVDRGSAAVEKTTAQQEALTAQVTEEQPAVEETATEGDATEAPSNMAQADIAAQESVAAEQAALTVAIPAEPQPFQHPDISAPVDSGGNALPRQASIDTQVRGLGYIGEMLRDKGYEIKLHSANTEKQAHGQQAVISKQKEDLALAKEGTAKIEEQNEERKTISETSKLALAESQQRQEFVASEAPGLAEEAASGQSDSSALASDASSKAAQSESEVPDDPDARADGEQQAEEMNQTSDGAASMDDAITQTGERATQYIEDAATASEDNQQSESSISENDGIIAQIDGRSSEMNSLNETSQADIDNVAAGPSILQQHAARSAQSADELISASIVIETELQSVQEEYLSSMAGIETREEAEQRAQEEAEEQAPGVSDEEQQVYEVFGLPEAEQEEVIAQMTPEEQQGLLATLDIMIANTPDNGTDATEGTRMQVNTGWGEGLQNAQDAALRFGLETQLGPAGGMIADAAGLGVPDPGDPRAQRIQEVDDARAARLSPVLDIADQNMNHLSQEQQQLLAERLVAQSITDDISNISILQMGKDMLIGMVNPAMALQGVVGGLEKTFSGVANIFNADAWEQDPLGNLLQIAADISTGLAMVFSSILGIAGMITALMIALAIFSWGTLLPITTPVVGWMGTVMTYAGWGAIIAGTLSVYFNSLAYIKNLHDAGTAETARELFGNTEQMKQNTTDGFQGAMAIVEGVGAVKMAPGMRSGELMSNLPASPGAFARQTMQGAREGLSNIAALPARAARGARRVLAGGRQGLTAFKRRAQGFFRHADAPDSPRSTRHTQEVLDGNRTRSLDEMTPEQRRIDLQETANHQPRAIDPDSPYYNSHDIEIESNGHTYRRKRNERNVWCRFSTPECGIGQSELPDDLLRQLDANDDLLRQHGTFDDTPENMDRARADAERDMASEQRNQSDIDDTPDADTVSPDQTPNPDHTTRQRNFDEKIDAETQRLDITPDEARQLRDFNEANKSGTRDVEAVLADIRNEALEFNPQSGRFRNRDGSRRLEIDDSTRSFVEENRVGGEGTSRNPEAGTQQHADRLDQRQRSNDAIIEAEARVDTLSDPNNMDIEAVEYRQAREASLERRHPEADHRESFNRDYDEAVGGDTSDPDYIREREESFQNDREQLRDRHGSQYDRGQKNVKAGDAFEDTRAGDLGPDTRRTTDDKIPIDMNGETVMISPDLVDPGPPMTYIESKSGRLTMSPEVEDQIMRYSRLRAVDGTPVVYELLNGASESVLAAMRRYGVDYIDFSIL